MAETGRTVVAIWLEAGGEDHLRAALAAIRTAHEGARLILLTTPEGRRKAGDLADISWEDGAARGAGAFLARARRLSWASALHIYDLEGSRATRFMRLCVWPRPQWHERAPGEAFEAGGPRLS
ncbi:hypothetical protein [Parvibaculum sp.]|mgnify:CR=1 FL=1|uniref:hypothetical protein n=1 Tax=Parvibaculum sp. TaxID=2024848 RepID=UPI000C4FD659|nr:hypothetical protein [Parvibaculum sp.]MAM95156.1 hypothetical protein [Parvibaculum sp.]HCX66277.1 hypothetical protein [Rhodobiaceae bacterium]